MPAFIVERVITKPINGIPTRDGIDYPVLEITLISSVGDLFYVVLTEKQPPFWKSHSHLSDNTLLDLCKTACIAFSLDVVKFIA